MTTETKIEIDLGKNDVKQYAVEIKLKYQV